MKYKELKEIVADVLNIDIEEVVDETPLEDLNIDSLELIEIVMRIEDAIDTSLSDDMLEEFKVLSLKEIQEKLEDLI